MVCAATIKILSPKFCCTRFRGLPNFLCTYCSICVYSQYLRSKYVNVCECVLTAPIDGISRARKQVLKWNLQIQNHNWQGRGEEMYKRGQGFAKGTARNKSSQCSERRDSPLNTSAQNTRQGCLKLCTFEEKYSLNRKCHSRPMQGKVYSKLTCCDAAFIPWSKAVMFSPNRCSTFSRCSK